MKSSSVHTFCVQSRVDSFLSTLSSIILLLGMLGCTTSTDYVPRSLRASQFNKMTVEIEVPNKIDFMDKRLQGWNQEWSPALFGALGHAAVQSGRELSDAEVANRLSVGNEMDLVALLVKKIEQDFLDTGKVKTLEVWRKGYGNVSSGQGADYLKVSIASWGLKQMNEGRLRLYMDVHLNFRPVSGAPPYMDYQVIMLETGNNLDNYTNSSDLLGQDMTRLIEAATKRIVVLILN